MLSIEFFIDDNYRDITGYELGNIKIILDKKDYVLEDKKYYFMVFVSAINVLDSVYHFYPSENRSTKFYFADSSFYLKINRLDKDIAEFYRMDKYIGTFSDREILFSIYEACNNLYLQYKNHMDEKNFFIVDMKKSLKNFTNKFIT